MRVHLKSGEVLDVEGDTPLKLDNGLVRFDKLVEWGMKKPGADKIEHYFQGAKVTSDPLVPYENIAYIEKAGD